ncbi:hypothetical protein ZWY2020_037034 [Hordeum vulgare]|nr:hypothetical protein ZWY2020_037034 [Hordeum vulgare]
MTARALLPLASGTARADLCGGASAAGDGARGGRVAGALSQATRSGCTPRLGRTELGSSHDAAETDPRPLMVLKLRFESTASSLRDGSVRMNTTPHRQRSAEQPTKVRDQRAASKVFLALILLMLVCGQLVIGGYAQAYIGGIRGGGGSAAVDYGGHRLIHRYLAATSTIGNP